MFVIGPTACFSPWRYEFEETLGRCPDYRILAGGDASTRKLEYYRWGEHQGELYLITFQTLLNDINHAIKFLSHKEVKAFIVVDEAHYIKQINGEWAKAVLSLAPYAKYRCVLTGTPIPKSFADLFNLFDFLYPETPTLDSGTKQQILDLEKQNREHDIKILLKGKVEPLFYRVRKKDLGLTEQNFLPPIMVQMNKYEKILYKAIITKIIEYSKSDYLNNINTVNDLIRGRMMRLRTMCVVC